MAKLLRRGEGPQRLRWVRRRWTYTPSDSARPLWVRRPRGPQRWRLVAYFCSGFAFFSASTLALSKAAWASAFFFSASSWALAASFSASALAFWTSACASACFLAAAAASFTASFRLSMASLVASLLSSMADLRWSQPTRTQAARRAVAGRRYFITCWLFCILLSAPFGRTGERYPASHRGIGR